MILLALSFQLCLVNTLLTILNSSSLHPLKFLPALKCSLDFFTVLLPFPDDSNTHQKLYLPNFPLPFFQSPLHHFLSYVFILSKQNCCKSTALSCAATFHKSPLANVCNVWCYAISYNRASFHLMGTTMWSKILHFCNCFSSYSKPQVPILSRSPHQFPTMALFALNCRHFGLCLNFSSETSTND